MMKAHHLKLLRDPKDLSVLRLTATRVEDGEILEGLLQSDNATYPITNGIPRFVESEGYSENFGWQWKKWSKVQYESENEGLPMDGWTENMFFTATQFQPGDILRKTVLEVGCGGGRFADRVIAHGGRLVAIDYSEAIDVARELLYEKNPDALFIQGDALNLPLADESIDEAYSIGVLHHTPDPAAGVASAARVLKRGGRFAVSVYRKGSPYGWLNVSLWRRIFNSLPSKYKHQAALAYSTILCTALQPTANLWKPLTYPIRLLFPTVYLPDLRWSILDTFDSLTTSYQSTHHYASAQRWFREAGFSEVLEGQWGCNPIGKK